VGGAGQAGEGNALNLGQTTSRSEVRPEGYIHVEVERIQQKKKRRDEKEENETSSTSARTRGEGALIAKTPAKVGPHV